MSFLPGKFVWFEHASTDPAAARKFYEPLFGWHVENMAMGDQQYAMIMNGAYRNMAAARTATVVKVRFVIRSSRVRRSKARG